MTDYKALIERLEDIRDTALYFENDAKDIIVAEELEDIINELKGALKW